MWLLVAAALADCAWQGDRVDPFTGEDTRHLQAQMLLEPGGDVAGLNVYVADADGVRVELGFTEVGATDRRVAAQLQFLLLDGSVVPLSVVEADSPVAQLAAGPFGALALTTHRAEGRLPRADARRLATSTTVTQLRHDLLSSGARTRRLTQAQGRALVALFRCALDPT